MASTLTRSSAVKLAQCDPRLQAVVNAALISFPWPVVIIYGYRGKDEQELAFKQGRSQLHFPHSKHNRMPSLAVDIAPLKQPGRIEWDDRESFLTLGSILMAEANRLNVRLRWGADWNMNGVIAEKGTREWDYPHFEIVEAGEVIAGKVVT